VRPLAASRERSRVPAAGSRQLFREKADKIAWQKMKHPAMFDRQPRLINLLEAVHRKTRGKPMAMPD